MRNLVNSIVMEMDDELTTKLQNSKLVNKNDLKAKKPDQILVSFF